MATVGTTPVDAVFERMAAYATDLERTSPPVFVGRNDELRKLEAALERVASGNPRGMTRIVQGVPGAGKSSLCDEFMQSIQGRTIGGRQALCAKMSPGDLDAPPLRFAATLNEALLRTQSKVPSVRGDVAACGRHVRQLASTAAQLGFKSSEYRINDETHGLAETSPLTTCINAYADHMWPEDVVVVLAFDEMQKCPVTTRTIHALNVLNERLHDSRIFVVCFGLQNTAAVMREDLQQSRVPDDAVTEIGSLHPGEGRQVLERTLDHFGLRSDNPKWLGYVESAGFGLRHPWPAWRSALVADLEARSSDFPQHLTAALRSACLALGDGRDSFSPQNDLLADIAARHERNKANYYQQRLGESLQSHLLALGAICQLGARLEDRAVPRALALAVLEVGDDDGDRVDREQAAAVLETALDRGVLGKLKKGAKTHYLPPPIPSMASYLAAMFGRMASEGDQVALDMAERCDLAPPP